VAERLTTRFTLDDDGRVDHAAHRRKRIGLRRRGYRCFMSDVTVLPSLKLISTSTAHRSPGASKASVDRAAQRPASR
jgi:hypothetical protein